MVNAEEKTPVYLNSEYLFFLWQVFTSHYTSILDERFLIEKGKQRGEWECTGFDEWSRKYNKTEIFNHFLKSSIIKGLIKELYISVRKIDVTEQGYPDIIEVKGIIVNRQILVDYFETFSETRITGLYEDLKLFCLGFYSQKNREGKYDNSVYFSYQADYDKIENYISEYIYKWKHNELEKPRNYISADIQISDFILIIRNYQKLYGNNFEYFIGANPQIDETTLIIYFQCLDWIKIIEFNNGFCEILGQQSKIKFYIQLTDEFEEFIKSKNAPIKNIIIVKELGSSYFTTSSGKRISLKGNGLKVISMFHQKKKNTVKILRSDIGSPSEDAFKRMFVRLNEDLKIYKLRIDKIRSKDEYEIQELGQ